MPNNSSTATKWLRTEARRLRAIPGKPTTDPDKLQAAANVLDKLNRRLIHLQEKNDRLSLEVQRWQRLAEQDCEHTGPKGEIEKLKTARELELTKLYFNAMAVVDHHPDNQEMIRAFSDHLGELSRTAYLKGQERRKKASGS